MAKAGAVFARGQRQGQIGHQQALAHLGLAAHKQDALRRQQSRLDPAGRRGGRLFGEQLRQRYHGRFGSRLSGGVFHSIASAVASSKMASFTVCDLLAAARRKAVIASLLTLRGMPLVA